MEKRRECAIRESNHRLLIFIAMSFMLAAQAIQTPFDKLHPIQGSKYG
jgi:hypothetical protein